MPAPLRAPENTPTRRPVEILTAEEVKSLLRACSGRAPTGIRNRAMLALGWRGGLRLGEVLSAFPKDLDRDEADRRYHSRSELPSHLRPLPATAQAPARRLKTYTPIRVVAGKRDRIVEAAGVAGHRGIDESECVPFQGLSCSICILSLENQSCEVVDATVSVVTPAEGGIVGVSAFLLSCERL